MSRKSIWLNFDPHDRLYSIIEDDNGISFQTHREHAGITFAANKSALKALSSQGYVLYMYMLLHAEKRCWFLKLKQVCKATSLSAEEVEASVQELSTQGYLTPGSINHQGEIYSTRTYHLWESLTLRDANLPTSPSEGE